MFSVEFGKIYRIFLISSVSELFGNFSWINFFRVENIEIARTDRPKFEGTDSKEAKNEFIFCIFWTGLSAFPEAVLLSSLFLETSHLGGEIVASKLYASWRDKYFALFYFYFDRSSRDFLLCEINYRELLT